MGSILNVRVQPSSCVPDGEESLMISRHFSIPYRLAPLKNIAFQLVPIIFNYVHLNENRSPKEVDFLYIFCVISSLSNFEKEGELSGMGNYLFRSFYMY